jgi:hypothetical protein
MTTNENKSGEEKVTSFRIVDGEEMVLDDRRPWKRRGIYLSEVCLAVHLSPIVEHWNVKECDTAKETLYGYLQRVHQTALEHGLVCPLACVVSLDDLAAENSVGKDIAAWGSAQDWHRGSFTLYVHPDKEIPDWDHWGRLADLLQPQVETLMAEVKNEQRDGKWFADRLRKEMEASEQSAFVQELVEICASLFVLDSSNETEVQSRIPADDEDGGDLGAWKKRILAKAREAAEEGKQP